MASACNPGFLQAGPEEQELRVSQGDSEKPRLKQNSLSFFPFHYNFFPSINFVSLCNLYFINTA